MYDAQMILKVFLMWLLKPTHIILYWSDVVKFQIQTMPV